MFSILGLSLKASKYTYKDICLAISQFLYFFLRLVQILTQSSLENFMTNLTYRVINILQYQSKCRIFSEVDIW